MARGSMLDGSIPPPLCGHGVLSRAASTAVCRACGSFWDLSSLARNVRYDVGYAEARLHHDPVLGRLKLRSVERWLEATRVEVRGRSVCEIGFGGGHVLAGLARSGAIVSGIEANAAALEAACALGLDATRLHRSDRLPARLEPEVDLWLFLDSFEHLPDPDSFLAWMTPSCSSTARALVVAPDALSASARWLGRAWPHRLPDHVFHWSRGGLEAVWGRHGWHLERTFSPRKLVSPATAFAHLLLKLGLAGRAEAAPRFPLGPLRRIAVPFNVGECGLLFARGAPDVAE